MSGGKKTPINEALLIPQVAAQLALGKNFTDIAQNLSVGYNTVKKIAGKEATKAVVNEITTGYKEIAKAYCLKHVTEMNDLAIEGMRKALKEGNIQAIRTHFQVVGVLGQEESSGKSDKGGGSLTILMPGATLKQEEVIDVTESSVQLGPDESGSNDSP